MSTAADEIAGDQRDAEVARLIGEVARPVAERVAQRFVRSGELLSPQDAQDVVATVLLRLVQRLRVVETANESPIASLPDYVATLTFNVVNDLFRSRDPERSQLRNRLRYALSHDGRLALWTIDDRLAGGLARWRGAGAARDSAWELPPDVAERVRDVDRPADALAAIFEMADEPFFLRALVDTMAPLWLRERTPALRAVAEPRTPLADAEWRSLLATLWREIEQLRPLQRKALLLNLRDLETSHALDLFVVTGTATLEAIAAALEMTPRTLSSLWSDLPLDDLRIAEILHLTRQQVINLRKSARERLTRRLREHRQS